MEVPNGWFDAGELIYIVEVLLAMILAHLQCHVFAGKLVGFDGVCVFLSSGYEGGYC